MQYIDEAGELPEQVRVFPVNESNSMAVRISRDRTSWAAERWGDFRRTIADSLLLVE